MGDKEEGGVKNIKKWVTSFIDGPPKKNSKQFSKITMKLNIFLLIIKILLFLISNKKNAHALRFESEPITVEPNVILLNSPASLTCNYMKSSNENVQGLRSYITTEGHRHHVRLLYF